MNLINYLIKKLINKTLKDLKLSSRLLTDFIIIKKVIIIIFADINNNIKSRLILASFLLKKIYFF